MTIPTLPTWTDQEVQSAGKLNSLSAALEAKFAGSIGGADLAWPLVAQGSIDMNGYSLLGLQQFWNVFNADEYDDIQAAIDAAEAAGGAGVFIPPNNVNDDAEGLTVSETVHIFGAGKKSVISLSSGATAGELIASTGSPSDLGFSNLVLDGALQGSGQNGVHLKNVNGCIFDRVIFKRFTGDALVLDNEGTAGNKCSDIVVQSCKFSAGSGYHISGNDIDGLQVSGCQFLDPGTDAINLVTDGVASLMRGILISANRFTSVARAVYIVGESATANENWRQVQVCDNQVYTASGVAITVGTANAVLKWVEVKDNTIISSTGGIRVQATGGCVCDNYIPSTTGVGIDMTDSQELLVENNRVPDATGIPIQSTNSDNCRVRFNDVHGSVGNSAEPIVKDGTTGNVYEDNYGDPYGVGGKQNWSGAEEDDGTGSGTFTQTYTIPANSVKAGDHIIVKALTTVAGTTAIKTIDALMNNVSIGAGQIEQEAGNTVWTWDVWVQAAANDTDAFMFMVTELQPGAPQDNQQVATVQAGAIDWTTDVLIDINWTCNTADQLFLKHFTYEIL